MLNIPIIGVSSKAHEMLLEGSKKTKLAEKAMKKKIIVSTADPKNEEIKGAFHHFAFRNKSKIEISNNCEIRKAMLNQLQSST